MERDRAAVAGRLASGYEIHWVDPTGSHWLGQLAEKLREFGVTLTGDVTGALLAGERYFSQFL